MMTLLAEPIVSFAAVRNLLAAAALAGGLFFMFVGAFGLVRLPDSYHRMHAASKCTTLGLTGMLLAAILHIWALDVTAKSLLVIAFTFVATPIGTHLLAKAAHHGKAPMWERTLSDDLAEDKADESMAVCDENIGISEDADGMQEAPEPAQPIRLGAA